MVAAKLERFESVLDVDGLAEQLESPDARVFEKREALNALAANGGPRAVQVLRRYVAQPDVGLERAAGEALSRALERSPEGAGYDRNSPCACGSSKKWKHCCGRDQICWADERRTRRADISAPWRSR